MSEDPNACPTPRSDSGNETVGDAAADREQDRFDRLPEDNAPLEESERPREYGGRQGPDPVRYGDWEKNGRCIDF